MEDRRPSSAPPQAYAYLSADARQPTSVAVAGSAGRPELIFPTLPETFPARELVKPKVVAFQAADGLPRHGQLFEADSAGHGGHRPADIFVHGGPVRQMLPGWHYMDYYSNSYAMNQYLASRGLVVLSVNYRGGTGYGQAFRRAKGPRGPRGASEYQDVLATARTFLRIFRTSMRPVSAASGADPMAASSPPWPSHATPNLSAAGSRTFTEWARLELRKLAKDFPGAGWGIDPSLYDLALRSDRRPLRPSRAGARRCCSSMGQDRSVPFTQTTDLASRLREQGRARRNADFPG